MGRWWLEWDLWYHNQTRPRTLFDLFLFIGSDVPLFWQFSQSNDNSIRLFGSKCAAFVVPARRPVREFYVLSLFLSVLQMIKDKRKGSVQKGFCQNLPANFVVGPRYSWNLAPFADHSWNGGPLGKQTARKVRKLRRASWKVFLMY